MRRRIGVVLGVLVAVLAAGALLAWRFWPRQTPGPVGDVLPLAVLQQRNLGLGRLVAAAKSGPLVPFDEVLVVVDQALVQDLLSAATPYERTVAGKYRVRVDRTVVELEDGLGLVRLMGRVSFTNRPEEDAYADLTVFATLGLVRILEASGTLEARVAVLAVEARRVDLMGLPAPVKDLVEEVSREKIQEFDVLAGAIQIPVKLQSRVELPRVGPGGGVHIPAAEVPVQTSVTDVQALRGKLFVAIKAGHPH
jgi:hypothetical protein